MRPPWWFCCGWWSPWCVLDTALHAINRPVQAICDRHDRAITGEEPTS